MGAPLVFFLHLPHFFSEAFLFSSPDLRGKPFAVVSGDGGRRRLLDVSPELRGRGLFRNMLLDRIPREARPHLVPLDPHLARRVSEDLIVFLDRFSPVVACEHEGQYALDMKGTESLLGRPLSLALRLLGELRRAFGFSGKVGIGETRLLAHMAALAAPLHGALSIWEHAALAFLHAMPLGLLPGLGAAARLSMNVEYGHRTLGELSRYRESELRLLWGDDGLRAHRAVTGRQVDTLVPYRFERSVQAEIPLGAHDREASRRALDGALVDAARRLRREGAFAHRFALELHYGDGRFARSEKRFREPSFHERVLRGEIRPAFDGLLARRIYAVKAVLTLCELRPPARQLSLGRDDAREDRITRAFDSVRDRYGREVLRLGFEATARRATGKETQAEHPD